MAEATEPAASESRFPSDEASPGDSADITIASGPDSDGGQGSSPAVAQQKDEKLQSSLSQLAALAETGDEKAVRDFSQQHGLSMTDGGVRVIVESAGDVPATSEAVAEAGGTVETTYGDLVQASVPLTRIHQLADSDQVDFLREPSRPILSVTSEGVADISADTWLASGTRGAGVKVAVLDLGFSGYGQRIAEGELPGNMTVASFRADGNIQSSTVHGTACAEVLYDMAPEAQLYLVNFDTSVELGNAVNYLISQDVDVISASWAWPYAFRGDGSGTVNGIADTATAAGIFWVNAAGNAATNHWSGAFTDADGDYYHEFSGVDESNQFLGTVHAGDAIYAYLTWDKWPTTDQDYDLYLYKSSNPSQPVAASTNSQTGSQPPVEGLYYQVPAGESDTYFIKIENWQGQADGIADLELYGYFNSLEYQVAAGSLGGQPADNASVSTVGAVNVNTVNLASYSSRGPTSDGRVKPDIVAPSSVSTVTYSPDLFGGTSAATPHVAGAAALLKASDPTLTATDIATVLESGAIDLGDPGKDNLFGSGKIEMGAPPAAPLEHYFPWYDMATPGMQDWVLVANPSATDTDIGAVKIGGQYKGGWQIPALGRVTPVFSGAIGGPVEVYSPGSTPLLISQRVLYNGGFTELSAVPQGDLESEYYFSWYDQQTPGMHDWILVGNEGTLSTTVEIYIGNVVTPTWSGSLDPGQVATPNFPGTINGPVRVRSTNGQPLVTSQRVVYNGLFSEVMGIPASSLYREYNLNWYDQLSPGFSTWILVANPGATTVNATIEIAGEPPTPVELGPGEIYTPTFPGTRAGPVKVSSGGGEPLIVSERSLVGNSFEELPGVPTNKLATSGWFTWYDYLTPNLITWLLVSNQGSLPTNPQVYIAGQLQPGSYPLDPGEVVPITYAGLRNGPVRVVSDSGQPLLVSERTLYMSSFNEVNGTVIP